MRVEANQQAASADTGDFAEEFARQRQAGDDAAAQSRALVVTETAAEPPSPVFREVGFLTHLIATREQAPQTRERRRADPAEALAAYRSADALTRL